jgi:hypothetical protein
LFAFPFANSGGSCNGTAMEVEPKLFRAIMVSSTFTDLEAHRREVIDAILRFGFQPNVMEYSGARSDSDCTWRGCGVRHGSPVAGALFSSAGFADCTATLEPG